MSGKTYHRIKALVENENKEEDKQLTEEDLVEELSFSNLSSFRVWKSRNKDKIESKRYQINKWNSIIKTGSEIDNNYQKKEDPVKNDNQEDKELSKKEKISKKNDNRLSKRDLKLIIENKVPSLNQVYQHLKDRPDHIHYKFFMNMVKRVGKLKEQIIVNSAMLEKFTSIQKEIIEVKK